MNIRGDKTVILQNIDVSISIPSGYSRISVGICIDRRGLEYYAWCPALNLGSQARSLKTVKALLRGQIAYKLSNKEYIGELPVA